jgi:rubrerythrin
MDIYEFALRMEEDGKNYYMELAEKIPKQSLKNIFVMLADDEEIHYQIIKELKMKNPVFRESTILDRAQNIFQELQIKTDEQENVFPRNFIEAYNHALEIEKKSIDFYTEKAKEVAGLAKRKIFEQLAQEERKHFVIIEKMIQFITSPGFWV